MADSTTGGGNPVGVAPTREMPDIPAVTTNPTISNEPGKASGAFGTISSENMARERLISEASSTAEDKTEENVQETCHVTFEKITKYLNGELSASLDDYTLLEKLNQLTTSKYKDMSSTTKTLITAMEELDNKYKNLQPYLEQIDRVEESVASLEQAAYRLDAYSKKLENKFKRLERR